MTLREYLQQEIEPARKQQQGGTMLLVIAGILFVIGQIISLFWKMGGFIILLPAPILFIIGFHMRIWAVISKTRQIQCPMCSNKLGYLFSDKNYTHKSPFLGIPEDVPEKIIQCPYCKAGMDEEIKITEPVN